MAGMKAHTEYLTMRTKERYEMVHLTPEVEAIVRRSGVVDGLCFVSPMHIRAFSQLLAPANIVQCGFP